MATKVSATTTKISSKYRPTEKERYMNAKQVEFFRQHLDKMRQSGVECFHVRRTGAFLRSEDLSGTLGAPSDTPRETDGAPTSGDGS